MNSSASGTTTRRPNATDVPMRSMPWACVWRSRATFSASSASRAMILHFSKYSAPDSVTLTPRVLRLSSRTLRRSSVADTILVTVGWVVANSFAAFEKLPVSTTRTNTCIARSRSMT